MERINNGFITDRRSGEERRKLHVRPLANRLFVDVRRKERRALLQQACMWEKIQIKSNFPHS